MSIEPTTDSADERHDEFEALRERVAALETELADRAARTNDALATAQERTYWLDRWHLDLNAVMARPFAVRLWKLMPAARAAYRGAKHARKAIAKARFERNLSGAGEDGPPARAARGDAAYALHAAGIQVKHRDRVLDLRESSVETPPLPHADAEFDVAVALVTWADGGGNRAFEWLRELHRVVRPGGQLVLGLATHGSVTQRSLLAHATPDWEVAEFVPGGAGGQDLYALRRR